jgi:hypothetical protein
MHDAAPFVFELVPDGAASITVGNPALADEIAETFNA